MIRYENQCVDCGLPCLGSSCPHKNVPVYICDECGDEDVDIYEFEDRELCLNCIRESLNCVNRREI